MPDTCTTITLPDFAQTLRDDIDVLRSLDNIDANLQDVIDSPMPSALAWTLQKGGVETLDVSTDVTASSEERFRDYIESGAEALELNNLPKPHLADYYAASEIASQTGHDLKEVLETFEDIRPIELGVPSPEGTQFSADTSPVNLTAPNDQNVAQIDGADPQNFQEYDVHLMANPIAVTAGTASHAYVLVVPKGTDVSDISDVKELIANNEGFVTRGGPDGGLFVPGSSSASPSESSQSSGSSRSSQSSDSSVEASGSSSEADDAGRTPEGDVYASNFEESAKMDLSDSSYKMQTVTITGDLNAIKEEVEEFRESINDADINYYATSQNSNTYAGDVFEKLTGEEPERAGWRLTPGLNNDLMNYEKTDYANDFSS